MYGNYFLLRRLFYICFDLKCYVVVGAITAVVAVGMGIAQTIIGIQDRDAARRAQRRALDEARTIAQDKIKYAATLDAEWKKNFGDTTAQVAEYYSALSSESLRQQYEATGNKTLEQSYNNFMQQRKQLETKINQMGMQNSSQALSALMQMSTAQMQNNAAINFETNMNKMKADQEVAQQKLAYNQTGKELQMASINTHNAGIDMLYNANLAVLNQAAQREQDANGMINAGLDATIQGINSFGKAFDDRANAKIAGENKKEGLEVFKTLASELGSARMRAAEDVTNTAKQQRPE